MRGVTSNPAPSGIHQGTPGGQAPQSAGGKKPPMAVGDEIYLWILVAIEVGIIAYFRQAFRRHHGG